MTDFLNRLLSINIVAAVLVLMASHEAHASFITFEYTAIITSVETGTQPYAPERLAQLLGLGGGVGATATGTISWDVDASTAEGSVFLTSNRPGGLAKMTFGTPEGLSIVYDPSFFGPMYLNATTTVWTFDWCCSPQTNVGGFEYTYFQLLADPGTNLSSDVPILQAFDPAVLDHGTIHFGGSYAYPLDVRADITGVRKVPEPSSLLLMSAGLAVAAATHRYARRRSTPRA